MSKRREYFELRKAAVPSSKLFEKREPSKNPQAAAYEAAFQKMLERFDEINQQEIAEGLDQLNESVETELERAYWEGRIEEFKFSEQKRVLLEMNNLES